MGGNAWTTDEIAALECYRNGYLTPAAVRETHPGRTLYAVESRLAAHKIPFRKRTGKDSDVFATLTRVVSETPERVVLAPQETDEEPIEDLLERAKKATGRAIQRAVTLRHAEARVVCHGKPIGIVFASDQHFSTSEPVDVERALSDAELIQQTPGLYCVLGGDGADNHIKHQAALVNKRSAPSDEWRLYDHYLRVLGQKVLAVISGNHDDWTKDFAGVDMVSILAKRHRLHYASDEVTLQLRLCNTVPHGEDVTGQAYTLKVRHQYRFNSSLNVGHTVKRMYDMGGEPFDVGVVCHHHEAHIESFQRHGLTRWALRPGSYQVQTSYGRRYGFNESHPTCPTVILWPDERKIVAFRDVHEAVDYLAHARAEAQAA